MSKEDKWWTCKDKIRGVLIENWYLYNALEELSDVDNIMDERELEPDYYIDRPVRDYFIIYICIAITNILA